MCGSQQDNSTLCVPCDWNAAAFGRGSGGAARRWRRAGPAATSRPAAWTCRTVAGGGEPGYIAPDPLDLDIFYSGTNNGALPRQVQPPHRHVARGEPVPLVLLGRAVASAIRSAGSGPSRSSSRRSTRSCSSSRRSGCGRPRDGGTTWAKLSGDLTRHDPRRRSKSGGPITGDMNGPEVYATIFSVGARQAGRRTSSGPGSDDGLVHVTRDGGKTWTNVTPKEMPDFGRVSQIDASAFDDGTAYVSVRTPAAQRLRALHLPHDRLRRARGRRSSTASAPMPTCTRCARIPRARDCSTPATQHGVYISYDDGAQLERPLAQPADVPVADLIVEANELVIGTHGRGFWILDNIAPLRQCDAVAHRRRDAPLHAAAGAALHRRRDDQLHARGAGRAGARSRCSTPRVPCCGRSATTPRRRDTARRVRRRRPSRRRPRCAPQRGRASTASRGTCAPSRSWASRG